MTSRPSRSLLLSLGFGLLVTWAGLLISFVGPWRHPPVGFSISALAALVYGVATLLGRRGRARQALPVHLDQEVHGHGGRA